MIFKEIETLQPNAQDLIFIFNGKEYPIFKGIFYSYSKKFQITPSLQQQTEFNANFDVSEDSFAEFIKACQGAPFKITSENIFDLQYLSSYWGTTELTANIDNILKGDQTGSLLLDSLLYKFNRKINTPEDETLIEENIEKFIDDSRVAQLPIKVLRKVIYSPNFAGSKQIDPKKKVNFLKQCLEVHGKEASSIFSDLMATPMTPNEVENLLQNQTIVLQPLPRNLAKTCYIENKRKSAYMSISKHLNESIRNMIMELHSKKSSNSDDSITSFFSNLNFAEGIAHIEEAANLGDPESLITLSMIYKYGIGVPCDAEKSEQLLEKSKTVPKEIEIEFPFSEPSNILDENETESNSFQTPPRIFLQGTLDRNSPINNSQTNNSPVTSPRSPLTSPRTAADGTRRFHHAKVPRKSAIDTRTTDEGSRTRGKNHINFNSQEKRRSRRNTNDEESNEEVKKATATKARSPRLRQRNKNDETPNALDESSPSVPIQDSHNPTESISLNDKLNNQSNSLIDIPINETKSPNDQSIDRTNSINDKLVNDSVNNKLINDLLNHKPINDSLNDKTINDSLNDKLINDSLNDKPITGSNELNRSIDIDDESLPNKSPELKKYASIDSMEIDSEIDHNKKKKANARSLPSTAESSDNTNERKKNHSEEEESLLSQVMKTLSDGEKSINEIIDNSSFGSRSSSRNSDANEMDWQSPSFKSYKSLHDDQTKPLEKESTSTEPEHNSINEAPELTKRAINQNEDEDDLLFLATMKKKRRRSWGSEESSRRNRLRILKPLGDAHIQEFKKSLRSASKGLDQVEKDLMEVERAMKSSDGPTMPNDDDKLEQPVTPPPQPARRMIRANSERRIERKRFIRSLSDDEMRETHGMVASLVDRIKRTNQVKKAKEMESHQDQTPTEKHQDDDKSLNQDPKSNESNSLKEDKSLNDSNQNDKSDEIDQLLMELNQSNNLNENQNKIDSNEKQILDRELNDNKETIQSELIELNNEDKDLLDLLATEPNQNQPNSEFNDLLTIEPTKPESNSKQSELLNELNIQKDQPDELLNSINNDANQNQFNSKQNKQIDLLNELDSENKNEASATKTLQDELIKVDSIDDKEATLPNEQSKSSIESQLNDVTKLPPPKTRQLTDDEPSQSDDHFVSSDFASDVSEDSTSSATKRLRRYKHICKSYDNLSASTMSTSRSYRSFINVGGIDSNKSLGSGLGGIRRNRSRIVSTSGAADTDPQRRDFKVRFRTNRSRNQSSDHSKSHLPYDIEDINNMELLISNPKEALTQMKNVCDKYETELNTKKDNDLIVWDENEKNEIIDASFSLGIIHWQGLYGIEKDPVQAIHYYEMASDLGDSRSMYNLATIYEFDCENTIIQPDIAKAVEWYEKAIKLNEMHALTNLGTMYYLGNDYIQKDPLKAIELFEKAAKQGDSDAQTNLGVIYFFGNGVPKDIEKAATYFTEAAEREDSDAQLMLAMIYEEGLSKKLGKNIDMAVDLYRQSAEQGNGDAQFNLGSCYLNEVGVERDVEKAIEWYKRAAQNGSVESLYNLGVVYQNGVKEEDEDLLDIDDDDDDDFAYIVKRDLNASIKYYRRAAAFNHPDALYNLGVLTLENEIEIDPDLINELHIDSSLDNKEKRGQAALYYFTKSAEAGCVESLFYLGSLYENGFPCPDMEEDIEINPDEATLHIEKNVKKAVEYYEQAAALGNLNAQYNLAVIYTNGDPESGIAIDQKKAIEYYKMAADQGDADAEFNLNQLLKNQNH